MADQLPLDITLVVLTKNEEAWIDGCLASARFASEYLVLDSGSTDNTCHIASTCGARIEFNPWPGVFSAQRNHADSLVTTSWIFQLDADEKLTSATINEIRSFFAQGLDSHYDAVRFPRRELMFGKWMDHGGWSPNYNTRMYRRGSGSWSGLIHDSFQTQGNVYTCANPILHHSLRDIHVFVDKYNRYSSIEADNDYRAGKKCSLAKVFLQPIERFVGRYVRHKGYRDGIHGLMVAVLFAFGYFLRNAKLWEKYYKDKQKVDF